MTKDTTLSDKARSKLIVNKISYIETIDELESAEIIYDLAFSIAVYARIYSILFHNEIEYKNLSDKILSFNGDIVKVLMLNYIFSRNDKYSDLPKFVKTELKLFK